MIFIISVRLIGRAEMELFNLSGPYGKKTAQKLANDSARTKLEIYNKIR